MITVCPNPTGGNTGIEFYPNNGEEVLFQLYDARGNLLTRLEAVPEHETWKSKVNTSELENGIYWIRATSTAGTHAARLVVKK